MPITLSGTCGMAIGDLVLYQGRLYYLRGIDPMSVSNRRAELEDVETGETIHAPVDQIDETPPRPPEGDV